MSECIWCGSIHNERISCDRVNMQDLISDLRKENDRHRYNLRKFYHSDGSFNVLESEEEVIDRRKAAAADIVELRLDRDRLRTALQWLVKLKDHKDKHGKTTEYLEDQPHAWLAAKKALNHKEG